MKWSDRGLKIELSRKLRDVWQFPFERRGTYPFELHSRFPYMKYYLIFLICTVSVLSKFEENNINCAWLDKCPSYLIEMSEKI